MANLLCIRGTLRRESPKHSRWKIPNCNLAKISDINWIPVTSKPTKHSGKSSGVFAAKDLLLQGRRQRGASGAATPIWNWCPSFHVWPPGCYIHPILYFKNVSPPSGFWPLLVFGPPLLLHPGDKPVLLLIHRRTGRHCTGGEEKICPGNK